MARYSSQQLAFLRKHRQLGREELTALFNQTFETNVSVNAIRKICSRQKIYSDYQGGWKKGQNAWHNGKPTVIPPKNGFKAGHISPKRKPVGTTYQRDDGLVLIKIADPDEWVFRGYWVWQSHFGEIPEGKVLWHKDGNPANDDISNLELLSRLELLQINRLNYQDCPEQWKPTLALCGKLNAQLIEVNRNER